MLHEPARHEPLLPLAWDEGRVREAIARIAADALARFTPEGLWPAHPNELEPGGAPKAPATPLYHGAAGVVWALDHLRTLGAVPGAPGQFDRHLDDIAVRNRAWLAAESADDHSAAYLDGDTPLLMMAQGRQPTAERADRLAALIERNLDHPARELMRGAPGTMLAALFLHRRFGDDPRWAELFRHSAAQLWSQLLWSDAHGCAYWDQELFGRRYVFLDGVHGFVGTASVLIQGHDLLPAGEWSAWADTIANTVRRTAMREGDLANWPEHMVAPGERPRKLLMQFCHGSPGFVICLAGFPDTALDDLLLAGGEATWVAGPLAKGSNLCHGTGGNGYAFLALYRRTGDARWLDRARAFAMHGIAQTEAAARQHGQGRYSLWTGDPGFAVYLWDCIHPGRAAFPTLEVFYAGA